MFGAGQVVRVSEELDEVVYFGGEVVDPSGEGWVAGSRENARIVIIRRLWVGDSTVFRHNHGPIICELLSGKYAVKKLEHRVCIVAVHEGRDDFCVEAASDERVDEGGTVGLGEVGDDVSAIC